MKYFFLILLQVSSSCDGTVKIWSIELQSIVFQLSCLPVCNAFDSAVVLGRPSWQPSGRLLAIPSGSSVKIYERATWNVTMEFSDERVTEVVATQSIRIIELIGIYLDVHKKKKDLYKFEQIKKNNQIFKIRKMFLRTMFISLLKYLFIIFI